MKISRCPRFVASAYAKDTRDQDAYHTQPKQLVEADQQHPKPSFSRDGGKQLLTPLQAHQET